MSSNNPQLNKFKIGDKVVTTYNRVYTIRAMHRKLGIWHYECEDMHNEMFSFEEDVLKFYYKDSEKPNIAKEDIPNKCPICSSEWKRTAYGYGTVWLDCIKCNLTAEEAVERHKRGSNPYQTKYAWDWSND